MTFLQGNLAIARNDADREYQNSSSSEWKWKFRVLEAEILTKQGLSQDVITLLDENIPASLSGSDLDVRRHMLLALANSHLGGTSQADEHLQRAEQLCASTCPANGEVARIAGAIASERNDPDQAEHFFRESLKIARQQGDPFLEASDLLNLGVVSIGREHFDESVDWSDAATYTAHAIHANLTEEKALGNLGWAYYKMGDFAQSLDCFTRAAQSAHGLGAMIDEVEWLNNLGLVFFQQDNFADAEKYYRQSLELARSSQNKDQMIAALSSLALVLVKTGDDASAKKYSDETLNLAHTQNDRQGELDALLVQAKIAETSDSKKAVALLSEVAADPKSDTSMRWEAENDLAKVYESQNPALADRQYRKALSTLEAARSSIRHEEFRLPFLANASHLYDDYVQFLMKQGKNEEALRVADFSRGQALLEGLGQLPAQTEFRPATINPQQTAHTADGVILFYWLGQERSFLWTITSTHTQLFQLPPRTEIEALAQKYNHALTGPTDVLQTENADGRRLYDVLISPAAGLINHGSRVFIIPDGGLNNLNFETLLVSQPTVHYWIDDAVITDANSLRLLAASKSKFQSTRNLLLVGDSVAVNTQYRELPNAAVEMDNVSSHFPQSSKTVLRREHASAQAYLSAKPESFSYIHFVAHGTASELNPLDSAIILSKSPRDDSYKLYAREIIQHPLHADLVTISSCYGEGARAYTGEGLVGLSWAFLRAGAHNVIGALWEVSDTSTPQLMDNLYAGLGSGSDPAAALRQAKLQMLHSDGVFRKPFYWAPFQLYSSF